MSVPQFSTRIMNTSGNVIREVLKLAEQSHIISFAGGFPSPNSFPVTQVNEIINELLQKSGPEILQYGSSEGFPAFREYLAAWLTGQGITATPDEVLITSGAQQVIDYMAKAFLNPGDGVIVENPTYLAALNVFKSYEAEIIPINGDANGVNLVELEKAAASGKAKMVYLVPTFANPTGVTTPVESRKKIVEILDKYGLIMLEDDPYSRLRYSGNPLPAVKSFDKTGNVVYTSSFSKLISPGMRVGYVTARHDILRKLVLGKQCTDVHTNNIGQRVVFEFCRRGILEPHIEKIIAQYKKQRDLMLDMCKQHLPAETTWNVPEGGLFLWLTLPGGINTTDLLPIAIEREKVAFIPGKPFFADGSGENSMRLNFSNASPEGIAEGMKRLGGVIKEILKNK
ncbi:MAG TPA: aminotransferase [Firmicutes bacterium]|nr:aminotransferase [Bacillota bacterium]HAW70337.1 aminotransferase [Bacillota bacterium]HAZ22566.1 aminotransferase [Bacillota bacterium]HBE04892.1 aminotransferase [Bacillota bacterium]HBG43355.1 aminotransferase [Bacillota bacterium]